ncbi:hypothetical protein F2Q70_00023447 [Brassica cretica]|uniref:Uncharacterized protein n=1 Tax=Brassica cretica TaxID=69181 RepID=A0A8S9GTG4_BRACR|nr:hypothetical protein F2Q70_00023447 [Brassica cretica]
MTFLLSLSRKYGNTKKRESSICALVLHLLFLGNGGSNSIGFAGFRLGKTVALIAPSSRQLLLRFDPESVLDLHFCQRVWAPRWSFGRTFSLILAEAVVDFRWISDDCGDGVFIPVMWWGFDLRTRAPLMVFRSRRGGRVTRVPRSEDFDTCPVHATRVNEEAPSGLG